MKDLLLLLLSHFSCVRLSATPQMAAHQAPLSLGFSRQEHWSGLPFPSPVHESEKLKWSRSVVSDSSHLHGVQPTRLFHPWGFPGKSTGVGCHCLLRSATKTLQYFHSAEGSLSEAANFHTLLSQLLPLFPERCKLILLSHLLFLTLTNFGFL